MKPSRLITAIALLAGVSLLGGIYANMNVHAEPLRFVAYGDAPYVAEAEVEQSIGGLIDAVNARKPALVVHVGDFLGGQPCTNSMFKLQREMMNRLDAPVLYTPGDNEWRDCYDDTKGAGHNLERLDVIRKTYFAKQQTLGKKPAQVENQASRGFPENARLMVGNVAFIAAHVVGSNNNFDPQSLQNTEEYFARDAANIAWVKESFQKFEDAEAFVVAIHADMYSEIADFYLKRGGWLKRSSPFSKFGVTVHQLSSDYEKPVLILYGDSHEFKVFKPVPKYRPFLTAIQVFGHPDIKAIEIEVDPSKRKPFRVVRKISG